MGLNASAVRGNKKPVEALDPDVYRARLVQLFDLGLQPQQPFAGKDKPPCQEIMLTYEICDEFMKDDEGNELKNKPRWLSETLPFYGLFADKAKSTQRYLAFDPEQVFGGDFSQCIGVPVNLTVVNNVKGDVIYNNVGNVTMMPAKKALTCPDLVNPSKVFDLDKPDMEVFNSMPDWLKAKIKGNLNFQGSPLQKALGGKAEAPKKVVNDSPKIGGLSDQSNSQDNSPY